jgi:hypothetical protein
VQAHHTLAIVWIARDRAREMKHRRHAVESAIELVTRQHVTTEVLDADLVEDTRARARQAADDVALLDEDAAQVLT